MVQGGSPSSGKSRLGAIFLTVFLDMLGVGIIIPILAPLFLGATSTFLPAAYTVAQRELLYGLLIAVYPLMQFFGAPFIGALSDRYGRKPLLLYSLAGTLIGYVLFAVGIITRNVPLLFASRALDGFTGGNITVAMSAIADVSDPSSKARNFGLIGMAFGLGFILGPFLGGQLADPHTVSWFTAATPLWFAALLSALNITVVWLRFAETLKQRRDTSLSFAAGLQNVRQAFTHPKLRTMFIVVFLFTLGFSVYTQFFMPVYLQVRFHADEAAIGNLFGYLGLWIVFTQGYLTRRLSHVLRPEQVLRWSLLCLSAAFLLVLVPRTYGWLFVAVPFMPIFQGLSQPNNSALISNLVGADEQGEILGMNQSMQSLAMLIAPLASAAVVVSHISYPAILASILVFCAWLVFVGVFRPAPAGTKTHRA
jgi:DHA1 family tetracycline resistance protein-like MFS transporter